MHKSSLKYEIRRKNPYRKQLRENHISKVAPNRVDCNFLSLGPRSILLTDITYLHYGSKTYYLSNILDAFAHKTLAYALSPTLEVGLVLQTVEILVQEHGFELDDSTIIHNNQGSHYTSKQFIQKLKQEDFVQSMSRKGNCCWDNTLQKSFFGHMKDKIRSLVFEAATFE